MRTILTILLSCFITTAIMGQVDIEVKELASTMTPNYKISNTVKIIVRNNSEDSKILYLGNNPEITGYHIKDCLCPLPINLLSEVSVSPDNSDAFLPLMFFANWFKFIKPNEQFVMYFQRDSEINADGIKSCIRVKDSNYLPPLPQLDKLAWKEDEIVIHLPNNDQ